MPESARKRNAKQFFLVNHRYMRHPYFAKAVQAAYERLLPEGEQVPFFLNFEVDPARIDVNIHPSKAEIKFQDEPHIWQILLAGVREALGTYNAVPTIDFNTANRPDIPTFEPTPAVAPPRITLSEGYSPFNASSEDYYGMATGIRPGAPSKQPANANVQAAGAEAKPTASELFPSETLNALTVVENQARQSDYLHILGRYIVTYVKSGLMFIDQHRAHIRVLYERFCKRIEQGEKLSQRLLFPCQVELSASEIVAFNEVCVELQQAGFDILPAMREHTYEICAIPPEMSGLDAITLLHDILADQQQEATPQQVSDGVHRLALSLAQRGAIPEGQMLAPEEMATLMQQLFSGTMPAYTPDGLPIIAVISNDSIAELF